MKKNLLILLSLLLVSGMLLASCSPQETPAPEPTEPPAVEATEAPAEPAAPAEPDAEAVMYAQRAGKLTGFKQPQVLDTLAAAYAAAGDFDKAVETAEEAIELARSEGNTNLVKRIENRLQLYKKGLPFKEELQQ